MTQAGELGGRHWVPGDKTNAQDVTDAFTEFLRTYDKFREDNGLSAKIDNVYEVLVAMLDKLGRISRYIKHEERNDPKPNWESEVCTELTGLYVYGILLLNNYNLDISEGMKAELSKAVNQHVITEHTERHEERYQSVVNKSILEIIKNAHGYGPNTQIIWRRDKVKAVCTDGREIVMTPVPYKAWNDYVARMMIIASMKLSEVSKYQRSNINTALHDKAVVIHTEWVPGKDLEDGLMKMELEDV